MFAAYDTKHTYQEPKLVKQRPAPSVVLKPFLYALEWVIVRSSMKSHRKNKRAKLMFDGQLVFTALRSRSVSLLWCVI